VDGRKPPVKILRRETHPPACSGVMKPNAFLRPFRILVAATLLSGLAPGTACAQKKTDPVAADPAAPVAAESVRLDIELGDKTTVQEALDMILGRFRKAGESVNVLARGKAGTVRLPPISLQRVTFAQAVNAVVFSADPPLVIAEEGEDMFALAISTMNDPKDSAQPKMRAFNVSQFLRRPENWPDDEKKRRIEEDRYKERFNTLQDAIAKGIELGSKLNPNLEQPKVEFEDRAGLLFASGSPEAVEIVAEVVRALCEPYAKPAPPAKP